MYCTCFWSTYFGRQFILYIFRPTFCTREYKLYLLLRTCSPKKLVPWQESMTPKKLTVRNGLYRDGDDPGKGSNVFAFSDQGQTGDALHVLQNVPETTTTPTPTPRENKHDRSIRYLFFNVRVGVVWWALTATKTCQRNRKEPIEQKNYFEVYNSRA